MDQQTCYKVLAPICVEFLEDKREAGFWDLYDFVAYVGQESVGYIRVEMINEARAKADMPTVWHFRARVHGWCYNLNDLRDIWLRAHLYARCTPASCKPLAGEWNDWQSQKPNELAMAKDLLALDKEKGYSREFQIWLRTRKDFPFIGWIEVNDGQYRPANGIDWRRKGIGTRLYQHAAKHMASLGYALYSSSLQSKEAKECWKHMYQNNEGGHITKSHKLCVDNKKERYKMDYRTKNA